MVGLGDRGYRRSIGRDEREPNVAEVVANFLWYCVVFANLDCLSDASWVPVLDGYNEFCCLPVHSVVSGVGVLDYR